MEILINAPSSIHKAAFYLEDVQPPSLILKKNYFVLLSWFFRPNNIVIYKKISNYTPNFLNDHMMNIHQDRKFYYHTAFLVRINDLNLNLFPNIEFSF